MFNNDKSVSPDKNRNKLDITSDEAYNMSKAYGRVEEKAEESDMWKAFAEDNKYGDMRIAKIIYKLSLHLFQLAVLKEDML